MAEQPVLEIYGLSVSVRRAREHTPVVSNVSLSIGAGERVGMLGESGSGKTVTAMAVARLLDPDTFSVSGRIAFKGEDLLACSVGRIRALRGSGFSLVFQDAMAALDPLQPVGKQVAEAVRAADRRVRTDRPATSSRSARRKHCIDLLEQVGLREPETVYTQLPGQLSGGMAQRVVVAMAIANSPALLIADEPTTALDVTVQAQILQLLDELCDERKVSLLMISHDIGVVGQICDRMVTLYAGEVVESGPSDRLLQRPRHPYTSGLFQSLPSDRNRGGRIPGLPPPPNEPLPEGCRFAPRCEFRTTGCSNAQLLETIERDHDVRCHRARELPELPGVQ